MTSIQIIRELSEDRWRRFVEEHPNGNIFHTPEMFQVFARVPDHRPELWAAIKGDRILALMVPIRISLGGGWLRPLTTRSVAYGSILCAPEIDGHEALTKLLKAYVQCVKGRPLFTELRNISDNSSLQPVLNGCGFVSEGHLNYLIHLDQSEQILWQNISKSVRKHIHHSQKRGVEIIDITERGQLLAGYKLIQQVFRRIRVPLANFALFESALEILVPRGMLKILLARANAHYVSIRFELTYKETIYDWYMGTDRGFSSYYPEESLIWHILQWGKQHNYRIFDFGGAGKPDEKYGPREFKAKWGGVLVNYGRNTYTHAPLLLKLSKAGYQLSRKIMWPQY